MDGAFCLCSPFISSVFLHVSIKLTDTDQMEQYHRKPWGGSVAVTTRYVALVRHEEEITMEELFEERFCELVRNFKHIYDVTSPGHRDKQMLQNSWEEIGKVRVICLNNRNVKIGQIDPLQIVLV